ncbi:hypothetical protein MNB_SUP05-SYMBIONT-4-1155 [hydrothermal vent metagenome]|uniref:Uncharacterized protein n=1 Tax=hydrothermal vent metagenome TaxID=652676 RepID=A0A1W1DYS1_9ZZZZ
MPQKLNVSAKAKQLKKYEFGAKASLAITNKEGFAIGAMSCSGK